MTVTHYSVCIECVGLRKAYKLESVLIFVHFFVNFVISASPDLPGNAIKIIAQFIHVL